MATASRDDSISLWEVQTGVESKLRPKGESNCSFSSIAFSPDGTRVATCSPSPYTSVEIWDVQSRKLVKKIEFSDRAFSFSCVAFNQDSTRLAVGFYHGNVAVLDTQDWRELNRIVAHLGGVSSVAFSPNGKRLATAGRDNLIKLWDVQTGAEVKRLASHTDNVSSLAFNSDGTCLASGSWDGTTKLWLAPRRSAVKTFSGLKTSITYLSLYSDDNRVYCKDASGKKAILDLQTGKEIENGGWHRLIDYRKTKRTSADQRWFLTSNGNNVVIVDRELKNSSEEKALRKFRSQSEPFWHEQQANQSIKHEDWFAATFHWAWALKLRPNRPYYYDNFHNSYRIFSGYALPKKEVNEQLPVIVREALEIARPELVAIQVPLNHTITEAFKLPNGHLFRYKGENFWTQLTAGSISKTSFRETERDSDYIYLNMVRSRFEIRIPLEAGQASRSTDFRKSWSDWKTTEKVLSSDFSEIKEYHFNDDILNR